MKLGDFADSDTLDRYSTEWYMCEDRYCPPGSNRPHRNAVGTMNRELFALGSAIYEILECKVPYGTRFELYGNDVIEALSRGEWPELSDGDPARATIEKLWAYSYGSSQEVVDDLQSLLLSYEQVSVATK